MLLLLRGLASLLFALITRLFELHQLTLFPRRVFGVLRPLRGSPFLFGQQPVEAPCDNLIKRGLTVVGWCCMCWCSGEAVSHMLIHSDVAYA